MKKNKIPSLPELESAYTQLRRSVSQVGWISEGYAQNRGPGAVGPCYQWTRKVEQKTVTVSLTSEQFAKMKEAVGNYRKLRRQLREMELLSRRIIFQSLPHPSRHKKLSQKVLGTK